MFEVSAWVCVHVHDSCKWFFTLDLWSGYWQVELDKMSKENTAFSTGSVCTMYEYNCHSYLN